MDSAGYQHDVLKFCATGDGGQRDIIEFTVSNDMTTEFRKAVMEVDQEEWKPLYRREKGREVPRETLLDAATLAVHFSKARDDSSAEVHVTPARYVRPLKGAPPGTVRVERSETLALRPDAARLTRLLATREP